MLKTDIAYYRSPVGILFIKSNDNAIEEILFTNSFKGSSINEIEINFDVTHSSVIERCCRQLDEYFTGVRKKFDLPINQSGTEFQMKVWNELSNIRFGLTISYLELSKRIGSAKAIRAVGTCNGNNKICIIVPCHRVIGSKGNLVGYGGDLWRKKWLLEHEAKWEHGVQSLFTTTT